MIRSNRTRRQVLKARVTANRIAARIHRNGAGTLAAHAMAQGLSHRDAASIAGTLRKTALKLGITGLVGRVHAGRHMRDCVRFTPQQVALICVNYKPRRAEFKLCAARLALAA